MKLSDITQLSKDDILGALGLESKRTTSATVVESLAVFSVGVLVGASVALMMAPKSGRELREDLTSRIRRVGHETEDAPALKS